MANVAALSLPAASAADPVQVQARFVTDEQPARPLAGQPIRIVVGGGTGLLAASAGATYTPDTDGRVQFETEAAVVRRSVTLDNPLVQHDAWSVQVGIELDLVGRPALYIVRLDLVAAGALGVMTANLKGPGGDFDAPLVFHGDTHSWTFPGEPDGWRLSDIGARMLIHDFTGSPEAGWTVTLEIAKQEFTVR